MRRLIFSRRRFKEILNACIDELVNERNATTGDNSLLHDLDWRDICEALRRTFSRLDVLSLNKGAWAADGLIPFDRRVSVQLAIVEAERAEEAERLIHSLTTSSEPARQDASELVAMAPRHILPRITAHATKSLREALEGFDRAKEFS